MIIIISHWSFIQLIEDSSVIIEDTLVVLVRTLEDTLLSSVQKKTTCPLKEMTDLRRRKGTRQGLRVKTDHCQNLKAAH